MISRKMLDGIVSLDGARLTAVLKTLVVSVGLPSDTVNEKTAGKIRAVLSRLTDEDLSRISTLAEIYKNGG